MNERALSRSGVDCDRIDPTLHACVAVYTGTLDEGQQVDFKGNAKVFCRTYDFLSSAMPYINRQWEKLSILLNPALRRAAPCPSVTRHPDALHR